MPCANRRTVVDILIEAVTPIIVLITVVASMVYYRGLPDTIPTHYSALGEVDGYGDKTMILILPLIALVTYIVIVLLKNRPHLYNFPVKVTKANSTKLFCLGRKMIIRSNLLMGVLFCEITLTTIRIAYGKIQQENPYITWIIVALLIIMTIYYMLKMYALR